MSSTCSVVEAHPNHESGRMSLMTNYWLPLCTSGLSPVRYCGLDAGRRHRFQALPLGKECRRRGRVSTHFNILAN